MDAKQVRSLVFAGLDGVAYVFPVTAPFVPVIEKVFDLLNDAGAFPQVLSPEAQTAMLAGMAAAKASAVTSYKAHIPHDDLPRDAFAGLNSATKRHDAEYPDYHGQGCEKCTNPDGK